ncbi:hypothetical protein MasN3_37200 [Massilia varians]|uniref:Uncharacterized protein n=1 Tax=Massilia varians TaxID=457921 RepID=A0ABM8CAA9_9BURK|nr:hypothetical protein MasN3_37200 [Massilia varians]
MDGFAVRAFKDRMQTTAQAMTRGLNARTAEPSTLHIRLDKRCNMAL